MTTEKLSDGVYSGLSEFGMFREDVQALIAAAFPVKPPAEWFGDPKFGQLSPMTVDNFGRVSGHIASWRQSHIGMHGSVRAPRSKSKYAFFKTGVVETENGQFQDVGQITLAGGHAPIEADVASAVAHYDDTNSAVMDVNVGEDRFGIWAAGALRPEVSDVQLRAIRASSVSGDWRPINGGLELVAICAVNVPGIPIPRARVASGKPIALVAAGVEPLVQLALEDRLGHDIEARIAEGLADMQTRLEAIEARDPVLTAAERRELLSEAIQGRSDGSINDLRLRVHGETIAASLRSRVHG